MANLFARIVKLITPKRRWAQFSLATLFLVVTVLCVGLALIVVPAERQRRAVAAIEALGGRVAYADGSVVYTQPDEEREEEPDERPDQEANEAFSTEFLRRWLPRDYFDGVRRVDLDSTRVTDAGLPHLHGLTGLQELSLAGTQVSDAGLAHLHGMARLVSLNLQGTQVTDAGLAHLRGLTRLVLLYVGDTQVTKAGREQLREALPSCR